MTQEGSAVGAQVHASLLALLTDMEIQSGRFKCLASTSVRSKRIELMTEEFCEIIDAMRRGNVVDLADGLADLLYVVYGTAVAFGIPIESIFQEVHRSNMTKGVKAKDHHLGGDKGKGVDFQPADIQMALDRGKRDYAQLRLTTGVIEDIIRRFHEEKFIDKTDQKAVRVSSSEAYVLGEML